MIYQRICRRVCVAMALLTLTVKMVLATGAGESAGSAVSELAGKGSFISWMLYLEVGQVYSPQQAQELTEQTLLAEPQREEEPPRGAETEPDEEPGGSQTKQDESQLLPEDEPPAQQSEKDGEQGETDGQQGEKNEQNAFQEPTEPASDAPKLPEFTEQDAAAITIAGGCSYEVDKLALLEKTLELDFSDQEPTVLIVHTHSSEAYTPAAGWEYTESDRLRTQDTERNVVRVGEEIAQVLRSHGIAVIHDESINDYPSYNGAYTRTLERIETWMDQYPSIQMVLDVHRDAQEDEEGNPLGSVVTVDGEPSSQVMLVVGTDEGGLEHPDWRENLALALQLQALTNRQYPQLLRSLDLRTERFNQHMTKGSLLLEMGSTGNTLEQALRAARAIGESLAQLLAPYGAGENESP